VYDSGLVAEIQAYEAGEMHAEGVIAMFQRLIDSGLVWKLQGSYGRAAAALIRQGQCTPGLYDDC